MTSSKCQMNKEQFKEGSIYNEEKEIFKRSVGSQPAREHRSSDRHGRVNQTLSQSPTAQASARSGELTVSGGAEGDGLRMAEWWSDIGDNGQRTSDDFWSK